MGCLAESALMYTSLPTAGVRWGVVDIVNAVFMVLWWGGLGVMYTYMLAQRRRALQKSVVTSY